DCSPANRERELGLDRRETVVKTSTRGTFLPDNWSLPLADRPVGRCYHPLDYG
ncbi:hypothetical protein COEREDRAFT_51552, partial [Coemansia reversa NRRL 1564]